MNSGDREDLLNNLASAGNVGDDDSQTEDMDDATILQIRKQ